MKKHKLKQWEVQTSTGQWHVGEIFRMGDKIVDFSVLDYNTYNKYIASFTTKQDFQYLRVGDTIAKLVKLGYRSTKVPYNEADFWKSRQVALEAIHPKVLVDERFSRFMAPDNNDPVLLEFKRREIPIFEKALSTIVFTMYTDTKGSEISAYIDLGMSWRNTKRSAYNHINWRGIYEGTANLRPKTHHLSYRNAQKNTTRYTDSDNFKVLHDDRYGLMFMHKGDHKYIPVGSRNTPFDANVHRLMVVSPKYGNMIFYDHIVRKKA